MSSGDLRIYQSSLFGRKVKKLRKQEKDVLDSAIRSILENPKIGQEKKGDLRGVRVHKFQLNRQLILLAYAVSEDELHLITFGSHENYYRDLKRFLE